jgi:ketosteroid isomerase-like protein
MEINVTKATLEQITLARSLFDSFATGNMDAWQTKLAPDYTFGYPGMRYGEGIAAARTFNEPFNAAFTDWQTDVHYAAVDGDTTLLRLTVSFTHSSPLAMPDGVLQPKGARCNVEVAMLAKTRDGRIVREETLWNVPELLAQINAVH